MDIKIRCPHCETKLIVGDELVGQKVLCEDCDRQFTVEAPAASASKSGERPRVRERDRDDRDAEERPRSRRRNDDDDDKPRRSRDDFDDEDDRPIRRKPKRSSSHVAPLIFGSLLIVMTLGVGVGLYFAFGFGTSTSRTPTAVGPNNFGVPHNGIPAAGNRFRLSDAKWVGGNTFTVTVESATGRPDATPLRIAYRSNDGSTGQLGFTMIDAARKTVTVPKLGPFRSPTTIWVEQNGIGGIGGGALSNTLTLN